MKPKHTAPWIALVLITAMLCSTSVILVAMYLNHYRW
jgi:hypothetical protein